MSELDDLPSRYHDYLDRFATHLGEVKVGTFAKWAGRIIKKLTFEEFTPAFVEYTEMATNYRESIDRGDTINDVVLRLVREKAAILVLEPPAY